MSKTIKQIADEIGVSKQAVYKRVKGKLHTEVLQFTHTEQGTMYISEQGESIIKQDFLKDNRSNGAHTERIQGNTGAHTEYTPIIETLQKTINTLTEQLAVKDEQLRQANNQIEIISKLLDQQQQLQAMATKKELPDGGSSKKGILHKFFGR